MIWTPSIPITVIAKLADREVISLDVFPIIYVWSHLELISTHVTPDHYFVLCHGTDSLWFNWICLTFWSAGAFLKFERPKAIRHLENREKSATAGYKPSAGLDGYEIKLTLFKVTSYIIKGNQR